MGALNSLKVFFIPAFAPVFFNLACIIAILTLPAILIKWGYHPILCLGIGVLLGGFFQLIVQIPIIFKKGYGPLGPLKLVTKVTKKIMHRVGYGTIGTAATQINVLITTMLATGTVVGAVSWLSYSFRLFQFPVGVFSVSISGSNLVHFSDSWKEGDKKSALEYFRTSYMLSTLVLLPATFLLFALSMPTVNLIYQRGIFNFRDTVMTTLVLKYYMLGLPFYGYYKIFSPIFYTLDKPRIPVIVSVVTILFNVIFCLLAVPHFGFKVLALGTSISMLLNSLILAILLNRDLDLGAGFFFNRKVAKIFLATAISFLTVNYLANHFFDYKDVFFKRLMIFTGLGSFGFFIFGICLLVLGEYRTLKRLLR
jgi:putative peptidoglycan lipid II flippase